jgi:hypothetical protein
MRPELLQPALRRFGDRAHERNVAKTKCRACPKGSQGEKRNVTSPRIGPLLWQHKRLMQFYSEESQYNTMQHLSAPGR